ncbi:hypothetical protein [Agromyces larvae]|uniref:Uncharacterized protein n=1 Tax=Agromyces larvae TaxID=2929802 RepID=A0ABY4C1W4_9MICO|nr:hypothetical protein [Agromyces larvae]UOE45471.1 hypothetical protein MTO99_06860 [Agromyces larvae]
MTKYQVVDDVFTYTTKAGHTLAIDLDLPADLIRTALQGDKDEDEQFELVRVVFGADFEDAYNSMGALERTRFQRAFFAAFQEAAEIPLGESLSSST